MISNNISVKRIMVALDGSNLAETVLPLVRTLASPLGAEVTLLHVVEYEAPSTVHGESHLTSEKEAEKYLAQVAAQLRGTGLTVTMHTHPNPEKDVAASIADHAGELDADLIVLAAHGHGGLREFLVGRIPQKVVALADRNVLIVPAPTSRDLASIRRILLPMDQAGEAQTAIPLAKLLVAACKAELVLTTVVPTPGTVPGTAGVATIFLPRTSTELLNWAEKQARLMLDSLAQKLKEEGITVSTEVKRGDPAQELVLAMARNAVDLVVMATHARLGLEGLLAGSVAPRVVSSGLCPVLLVPIKK